MKNADREYSFKQTHSGRSSFPGGSWGESSEFGHNNFRDSQPLEVDDEIKPLDNFVQSERLADDEIKSTEFNRSRFAEPYTGGQFSRSQYGTGSQFSNN